MTELDGTPARDAADLRLVTRSWCRQVAKTPCRPRRSGALRDSRNARSLERHAGGPSAEEVIRNELITRICSGRSVFGLEPAPRDSDKEQDPGIQLVSRSV